MSKRDGDQEEAMTRQIKASEIQTGMVLSIYGGTEKVPVTKVIAKWDAVQITADSIRWFGLGENETVEVVGYFNP
jgi:hypothetical protein